MSSDKFVRKPLLCPKCQSPWMTEKHVQEMFIAPYRGQRPLYTGATKIHVYCGDCNALVWKEGMDLKGQRSQPAAVGKEKRLEKEKEGVVA